MLGPFNISFNAFTSGIEWNDRLSLQTASSSAQFFVNTFEVLFTGHSIPANEEFLIQKSYSRSWHSLVILHRTGMMNV